VIITAEPIVEKEMLGNSKKEVYEFAGGVFIIRIEGEKGSLTRSYHSLKRLGITLPIEKEKIGKCRNQRVNITIRLHQGENKTNLNFRDWIFDTILPKVERIQADHKLKEKNRNFKDQEAGTTIEISAPGNKESVQIATYKAKI
jgi:hypothetical protein